MLSWAAKMDLLRTVCELEAVERSVESSNRGDAYPIGLVVSFPQLRVEPVESRGPERIEATSKANAASWERLSQELRFDLSPISAQQLSHRICS